MAWSNIWRREGESGSESALPELHPSTYGLVHARVKTTALTWQLEKAAWSTMKFFGRLWDPAYYRTNLEVCSEPPGFRSVRAEVSRSLASPADFCDVPKESRDYFRKASEMFRDSNKDQRPAWVVRDRRYVSAR